MPVFEVSLSTPGHVDVAQQLFKSSPEGSAFEFTGLSKIYQLAPSAINAWNPGHCQWEALLTWTSGTTRRITHWHFGHLRLWPVWCTCCQQPATRHWQHPQACYTEFQWLITTTAMASTVADLMTPRRHGGPSIWDHCWVWLWRQLVEEASGIMNQMWYWMGECLNDGAAWVAGRSLHLGVVMAYRPRNWEREQYEGGDWLLMTLWPRPLLLSCFDR